MFLSEKLKRNLAEAADILKQVWQSGDHVQTSTTAENFRCADPLVSNFALLPEVQEEAKLLPAFEVVVQVLGGCKNTCTQPGVWIGTAVLIVLGFWGVTHILPIGFAS